MDNCVLSSGGSSSLLHHLKDKILILMRYLHFLMVSHHLNKSAAAICVCVCVCVAVRRLVLTTSFSSEEAELQKSSAVNLHGCLPPVSPYGLRSGQTAVNHSSAHRVLSHLDGDAAERESHLMAATVTSGNSTFW